MCLLQAAFANGPAQARALFLVRGITALSRLLWRVYSAEASLAVLAAGQERDIANVLFLALRAGVVDELAQGAGARERIEPGLWQMRYDGAPVHLPARLDAAGGAALPGLLAHVEGAS
jgi:hypothetical protein